MPLVAAPNKCLAESNKSRKGGKATKNLRCARHLPGLRHAEIDIDKPSAHANRNTYAWALAPH